MKFFPLLKLAGKLCLGVFLFILIWFCGLMLTVGLEELRQPDVVVEGITMVKLWPVYFALGGSFLGVVSYYTMVGLRSTHRSQ